MTEKCLFTLRDSVRVGGECVVAKERKNNDTVERMPNRAYTHKNTYIYIY